MWCTAFKSSSWVWCLGSMQADGPQGPDAPMSWYLSVGSLGRPHMSACVKVPAHQAMPLHLAIACAGYATPDGAAAVVCFAAGRAQLAANKPALSGARSRARSAFPLVGGHRTCFCSVEI